LCERGQRAIRFPPKEQSSFPAAARHSVDTQSSQNTEYAGLESEEQAVQTVYTQLVQNGLTTLDDEALCRNEADAMTVILFR
jgi:hypothetical protein